QPARNSVTVCSTAPPSPRHAHPRDLPPFPTRRSSDLEGPLQVGHHEAGGPASICQQAMCLAPGTRRRGGRANKVPRLRAVESRRSEEHTSELQSLAYIVCRLLLEKKNIEEHRTSRPRR